MLSRLIGKQRPRLISSEDTFTGRIAALEGENETLRNELDQLRASAKEAADARKVLKNSLLEAQVTIGDLRENLEHLQDSNRRSETTRARHRARAKSLEGAFTEIISIIKRHDQVRKERLTSPPVMTIA